MNSKRSGFTLLEMILVLALIVLLSVIMFPSLEAWYIDAKVKAAGDHLVSCFSQARAQAIEDGRVYRFAVQPGSSQYRLAPDTPDFWGGDNGGMNAPVVDENVSPPLVIEDQLPSNITFNLGPGATSTAASTADSGGWVTILLFSPKGSCSDDRTIRLDLEGARGVEISVRALTGTVTVRQAPLAGDQP
jgi:prepilin-type N-terminal cleavage/methylation domain-containing protein